MFEFFNTNTWGSTALPAFFNAVKPPPRITVSEWAEKYRYLGGKSSAKPGRWKNDYTPYLTEMMDDLSDTSEIEEVIFQKAAQLGGTEVINNCLGYTIHLDPGPSMLVMGTTKGVQKYSKTKFQPMVDDCPELKARVSGNKSKNSNSTILEKDFEGGFLNFIGSNSSMDLRSSSIRKMFGDEVSSYPVDLKGEGSVVELMYARLRTYKSRRKIFLTSTPTMGGVCAISAEFEKSDQRRYYVPCPYCNEYQTIDWDFIRWEKDKPETAYLLCKHCDKKIKENYKREMVLRGKWKPTKEYGNKKRRGYQISTLYSNMTSWSVCVRKWLESQKDVAKRKAFVNTILGLPFEEESLKIDENWLMLRCENYNANKMLPKGVGFITIGIDTQDDRLELEVVGWGEKKESWSLEYIVIQGDPAKSEIWQKLTKYITKTYRHPNGHTLKSSLACIDSGGHFTTEVYNYCRAAQKRGIRVVPIKGWESVGSAVAGYPTKKNKGKIWLFPVGTFAAKEEIYSHLKEETPGEIYCHFPKRDKKYFEGLVSEKCETEVVLGKRKRRWKLINSGRRNEPLDCRVYGLAAYYIRAEDINIDKHIRRITGEKT